MRQLFWRNYLDSLHGQAILADIEYQTSVIVRQLNVGERSHGRARMRPALSYAERIAFFAVRKVVCHDVEFSG